MWQVAFLAGHLLLVCLEFPQNQHVWFESVVLGVVAAAASSTLLGGDGCLLLEIAAVIYVVRGFVYLFKFCWATSNNWAWSKADWRSNVLFSNSCQMLLDKSPIINRSLIISDFVTCVRIDLNMAGHW